MVALVLYLQGRGEHGAGAAVRAAEEQLVCIGCSEGRIICRVAGNAAATRSFEQHEPICASTMISVSESRLQHKCTWCSARCWLLPRVGLQ